jgi:hypothetical protein
MARFSLSFLALCFFLALMASALPAKRGDEDLDAGDAVAAALSALKVRISATNISLSASCSIQTRTLTQSGF